MVVVEQRYKVVIDWSDGRTTERTVLAPNTSTAIMRALLMQVEVKGIYARCIGED